MNFRYIARILGIMMLAITAFLLPSMFIALSKGEQALSSILSTMAISGIGGLVLYLTSRDDKGVTVKDAFLIVTLGWLIVCMVGALPFYFSGVTTSYIDAFFEVVSGFTTTGATILKDVESQPVSIMFWRSLTHWLGGMGILVLTLAVMPALGVGSFQIFRAETPGPLKDKVVPKMRDTAAILYTSYLGITALETVMLLFGGVSLFEALVHTFGSVGTGGFSTRNLSVGSLGGPYVQWVIGVFMLMSGVNFSLYYAIFRGQWRKMLVNEELRYYLLINLGCTMAVFLNLYLSDHFNLTESLRHSFFQVTSIMTTTGYTTANFDIWPTFSKLVLFLLMFLGASSGSTGGAIKVVRIVVVFKLVRREMQKVLHPKAVIPVSINGHALKPEVVTSIASFFVLYIMVFLAASLVLTFEGIDMVSATSSVAATLGNIGPGFGVVGPLLTYSDFNAFSKLLLSFMMLLGRLELFTILVVLTPSFWKQSSKQRRI